MKQNTKAAMLVAFAWCALVATATPCTPALGRQIPHVVQCLLTCRKGKGKGKGKGGGKGKGKGDPGDGVDEEVDEEEEEGQALKKRKRGPTVPPSGLTCVCMSVSLHVPTYGCDCGSPLVVDCQRAARLHGQQWKYRSIPRFGICVS